MTLQKKTVRYCYNMEIQDFCPWDHQKDRTDTAFLIWCNTSAMPINKPWVLVPRTLHQMPSSPRDKRNFGNVRSPGVIGWRVTGSDWTVGPPAFPGGGGRLLLNRMRRMYHQSTESRRKQYYRQTARPRFQNLKYIYLYIILAILYFTSFLHFFIF